MTNWKYTLTRSFTSHLASSEEIARIKVRCGLIIPAGTLVLGTVRVNDPEEKSDRRITLHLRTSEIAGNIHSPKGSGEDGGQERRGPATKSRDFVLVDRIVCFIVNTHSGRFSAIPWEQIAYISS